MAEKTKAKPQRATPWRWWRLLLALVLSALIVAGAAATYILNREAAFTPSPVAYDLRSGLNLRGVARELAALGVLPAPWLFELAGRVRGDAVHIKAGNYEIASPISPLALLKKLTRGDANQVAVRIGEGWTFRQVRQMLDGHEALMHDTRALSDEAIARKLDIAGGAIEGWLFPETYHVARGTSDWSVLKRAHRLMQIRLATEWGRRAADLPLASSYEALILGSIIEKETGRAADRAMVASVFVNRLRRNMRLQTDPTVIYGMGEAYNGRLRRADLQADTPWNTYTRAGLPPTPIAMPGLAALRAAVNPAVSDKFYFVARGDGSSQFSRTLDEHNAAVTKYLRSQ
jgi:UPF0755 protein